MSAQQHLTPLSDADYAAAALRLRCDRAAIKAVAQVEAPRGGFCPDNFPTTLFEGHKFSRFTQGMYDRSHPTISHRRATRAHYGDTWQAERARLDQAIALDREAALKSASWGKFQIMGFNYGAAGFGTIQAFVNAMCVSEARQLAAFVTLILEWSLDDELRLHRWGDFARRYNGPAYRQGHYDVKLAAAYRKLTEE